MAAPGSQRGDGKRKIGRHLASKVREHIRIEAALRAGCIEINLKGGNAWPLRSLQQQAHRLLRCGIIESRVRQRLYAHHRNPGCGGRIDERLPTGLAQHLRANQKGLVQIGNRSGRGIDHMQVFRAFPYPERSAR